MEKNAKLRTFAKLGYSDLETAGIVKKLNILLANYHVHYQKLRNYHWNVKGPGFFDLHDKFEEQYNITKSNIDDVAERIRVFGKAPLSRLIDYLEISEIKETGTNLSSIEMVREVLNDYQILLSCMIDVTDAAATAGDVGTDDMINTFVKQTEKMHWMFSAWLNHGKNDVKKEIAAKT